MSFLWLVACVIFAITEKIYQGFILIWFSISAFITFCLSFFQKNSLVQLLIFLSLSILLTLLLRTLCLKKFETILLHPITPLDLIGQRAIVISPIGGTTQEVGLVKLDNETWNAFSTLATPILPGSVVTVLSIKGLMVEVSPK
ncbi:MAG: NfeD family protein [Cellulosilyticaceae bacterium]